MLPDWFSAALQISRKCGRYTIKGKPVAVIIAYKDVVIVILGIIGFIMTLRTFRFNLQQRKIENTFKVVDFMRKHITQKQIDTFIEAFHANNPIGIPPHEFHYQDGEKQHLDYFFSEGGRGNGDIHNIIEIFNLVSISLLKNELKESFIWYEYGQIMRKCYEWTGYLSGPNGPNSQYYDEVLDRANEKSWFEKRKLNKFLKQYKDPKNSFSFHFDKYMRKASVKNHNKAVKYYTYIE